MLLSVPAWPRIDPGFYFEFRIRGGRRNEYLAYAASYAAGIIASGRLDISSCDSDLISGRGCVVAAYLDVRSDAASGYKIAVYLRACPTLLHSRCI